MKPTLLLCRILLSITCFVFSFNCQAQITKIAIVSVADTTCIHRHVGLTAFTNFIDTIPMSFPIIHHMEGKLMTYLSQKYSVSVVQLPDSVLKVKDTFFSSARTKKIKQWIKNSYELYDLVIVIDNMELSENYRLIPKYTSGIYSKPSVISIFHEQSIAFIFAFKKAKKYEIRNQDKKTDLPNSIPMAGERIIPPIIL